MLRGSSRAAIIRWVQGTAGCGGTDFFVGGGSRKSVTGSGVSLPDAAVCGADEEPNVTGERQTGQMALPERKPSGARKTTPQLQRTSAGMSHPLQQMNVAHR